MILKKLAEQSIKSKRVPVPELGKDAEIIITELNVADSMRLREVIQEIGKESDYAKICVGCLLCAMKTENGEYLVPENERLNELVLNLNRDVVDRLYSVYLELNPFKESEATLDAKKK